MCVKEDFFKRQFSKMAKLLKLFIAKSHKFNGYLHLKLFCQAIAHFENLCFILKIFRWVYFFCDSTSKYLTCQGGGGGEGGGCPNMYVQFFHSAIGWAAYPTGHHVYINIHFPSTLILWKILSLSLPGYGEKWKFKYLLIPF